MRFHPAPIESLPTPTLAAEVAVAIAAYQPKLLTPAQATSGLADMRRLIAACQPNDGQDAKTMLASLVRFVADVGGDDVDLDRLLVEWQVAQWQRRCAEDGMPDGTRSNHLQRLRRMMRVRLGLPARIQVRGASPTLASPLTEGERSQIEAALTADEGACAYVAACGAGLNGQSAHGATFELIDTVAHITAGTTTRRLLTPLQPFAQHLAGRSVGRTDWQRLGAVGLDIGVAVSSETMRATHAALAIAEPATMAELVSDFGVTRRQIDRAIKMRSTKTVAGEMRRYLCV